MFVSRKRFKELEQKVKDIDGDLSDYINHMNTNGVATAIKKLNKEVFGTIKQLDNVPFKGVFRDYYEHLYGDLENIGIKNKLDAIIEHLKVDINLQSSSSKVKVTPRKVVNKVTKKAGK